MSDRDWCDRIAEAAHPELVGVLARVIAESARSASYDECVSAAIALADSAQVHKLMATGVRPSL